MGTRSSPSDGRVRSQIGRDTFPVTDVVDAGPELCSGQVPRDAPLFHRGVSVWPAWPEGHGARPTGVTEQGRVNRRASPTGARATARG